MVRQISGPACACDPAGRAAFTLTEIDALVAAARQWESRDGHPRYIRIAEDRRMVQVAEDFPPHVKPDARRALVFEKPRTPGGLFRKEVVRFRVLLDPDIDPSGPTWDGFADMMAEIPRDEWGWEVQ